MADDKIKFSKLQINLTKSALNQIEAIQKRIEATSKTEVIRSSLRFYNYLTEEMKKDKNLKIILKDSKGKTKEVVFS